MKFLISFLIAGFFMNAWSWCPNCLECDYKDDCSNCKDGYYSEKFGEVSICISKTFLNLECTTDCDSKKCCNAYYSSNSICYRKNKI